MCSFPSSCHALNTVHLPFSRAPRVPLEGRVSTVSVCLSTQSCALLLHADAQDHGFPSQSHNPLCDGDRKVRNAGPGPGGLVQLRLQPQGSQLSWTRAFFLCLDTDKLAKVKMIAMLLNVPEPWISDCKSVTEGQMCIQGFPKLHST